MLPLIEAHIEEITRLCKKYGVRKLELFGSACRGEYDPETSDLDFIAEFTDIRTSGYVDRYFGFADHIEILFGKPVDVVTTNSTMSPHFRQEMDKCRAVVYEAKSRVATA